MSNAKKDVTIKLREGELNEKTISFTPRNLVEYGLNLLSDEKENIVFKWMADNCNRLDQESLEFEFWIPDERKVFEDKYLSDIPDELKEIFEAAYLHGQIQLDIDGDSGYLLIYYNE